MTLDQSPQEAGCRDVEVANLDPDLVVFLERYGKFNPARGAVGPEDCLPLVDRGDNEKPEVVPAPGDERQREP